MEDGMVVVAPQEGKVRVLNVTGSLIWELADGGHTIEQIAAEVEKRYRLPAAEALEDVIGFLNVLVSKGLVEFQEGDLAR
jgi:hypothetical protein